MRRKSIERTVQSNVRLLSATGAVSVAAALAPLFLPASSAFGQAGVETSIDPSTQAPAVAPASAAGTSPQLVGKIEPIYIEAKNSGATWIHLRNPTPAELRVLLTADGFRTSDGGAALEAKLGFAGGGQTSDSPALELTLPPSATVPVQLSVTRYFLAGEASSTLYVNDRAYPLHAEFYDVPLRVTPQKSNSGVPDLSLARGEPDVVVLKNDDPVTYPIAWRLAVRGYEETVGGSVLVAPNSQVELRVTPRTSWFRHWFVGLFKDEALTGQLSLSLVSEVDSAVLGEQSRALPSRSFPLQIKLAYGIWQNLLGNLLIFAVLALGACLSMVINLWIPNYQRRAELLGALQDMAKEIRKLFQNTDSRLRVGLRVERLWLTEQIRTLRVPSLSATDQLKKYQSAAAVLRRRVDMASQLEETRRELLVFQSANSGAPPSVLDAVASGLMSARKLLNKNIPTDDEFTAAKAAIESSQKRLAQIQQEDPALAKRLAISFEALSKWFAEIERTDPWQVIKGSVSELVEVLSNKDFKDPAKLRPDHYHLLDSSIQKLELLKQFLSLAQHFEPRDDVGAKVVAACRPRLVDALRKGDWHALARARSIVGQVRERVTSSDIEQALSAGEFRVECEPAAARANEPVRLHVRFANADYDDSAARDEFTCEWDFGPKVGAEQGWEIAHYFRVQAEATPTVTFRDLEGKAIPVKDMSGHHRLQIPISAEPKTFSDQTKAETLRLVLTMSIASVGLIAGARDQFMKLDLFFGLVSVLMVGFTANTIKELFTKSSA
jgi:hypothetical protein